MGQDIPQTKNEAKLEQASRQGIEQETEDMFGDVFEDDSEDGPVKDRVEYSEFSFGKYSKLPLEFKLFEEIL
jgi:hypothetical protein